MISLDQSSSTCLIWPITVDPLFNWPVLYNLWFNLPIRVDLGFIWPITFKLWLNRPITALITFFYSPAPGGGRVGSSSPQPIAGQTRDIQVQIVHISAQACLTAFKLMATWDDEQWIWKSKNNLNDFQFDETGNLECRCYLSLIKSHLGLSCELLNVKKSIHFNWQFQRIDFRTIKSLFSTVCSHFNRTPGIRVKSI